jgi:PPOX class probable F420-dependent enzyme
MQLPADAIEALLERWPVAVLSTSDERGPRAVPIVFVRVGEALWSPIDGKPKRGGELARVRRIRRDPRVSLLLANYDPEWTALWWLRVDGEAEIRNASEHDRNADESAAIAALRQKYPQYALVPVLGPDALLLRITITLRSSWCASQAGVAGLLAYLSRGADRDL